MNVINTEMPNCKHCQSKRTVKNGMRNGKQYWLCRDCNNGFVDSKALPRMRYPVDTVAKGVCDYYAGVSLNKIRESINKQLGLRPGCSAIYDWVKRLTTIGLTKANIYIPQVGNMWLVYDLVVRLKSGKEYWLINVIDYDTCFLLASKLSDGRDTKDIVSTLEIAKKRAGGVSPKVILTNGCQNYGKCLEHVFGPDITHIVTTHFQNNELSTNTMEHWYRTLKDRLKPMDGMDKSQTHQLILKGFTLQYNFLRPHENLKGKTPAEFAQIVYPYNSWLEIIKSKLPEPQ